MKNSIRKQRYHSINKIDINNNKIADINKNKDLQKSAFLYNFASMGIFIEILVGALLGISLCFGFVFSFIILRGNLVISIGIFIIILIFAIFLVLVLKYVYFIASLKTREIELLETINNKL